MRILRLRKEFTGLLFSLTLMNSCMGTTLFGGEVLLENGWSIQSGNEVQAPGTEISSVTFDPDGWFPTEFPTTVLAALVANGVYPDPYYGTNLATLPGYRADSWQTQDMPEGSPFDCPWWYRTEFVLPTDYVGKSVWLHLHSVNYKANVWMNGRLVANSSEVEGTYRLFDLDVTDHVRMGKTNCLALEILPPKGTDLTIRWMQGTRTPPDLDTGIWYDVKISSCGPLRLSQPFVVSNLDLPATDAADLNISAEISNLKRRSMKGILVGKILYVGDGGLDEGSMISEFRQVIDIKEGESKTVRQKIKVSDPQLWWPHSVGNQNLYTLALELQEESGKVSDSEMVRFGIREVSAGLESFEDKQVMVYKINGKRILIRGADYTEEMMMRPSKERDEAEIRYARTMNLNTLRMEGFWGTDYLYDLCDQYGIMVFDGTNCCCMWERWPQWTEHTAEIAVKSLRDQVIRKRNHPSLIHWVFGSDRYPPEEIERKYIDVIESNDGTRPYLPSMGNRTSKICGYTGYSTRPKRHACPSEWYEAEGFNWESGGVGAEQIPPIESMREMMPAYDLWPISGSWDIRLWNSGTTYAPEARAAFNSRYGRPRGLEDYCVLSQLWQLESNRAHLEATAKKKYLTSGTLKYRFNAGWPSLGYQYYDYYLRPNGAFYGAQKACEPIHVQYAYDDHSVYVVNSYYKGFENLRASAEVRSLDMAVMYSRTADTQVGPDASQMVFKIPALEDLTGTYFMSLRLEDHLGKLLSSNFYWLSVQDDKSAEFRDLRELPTVEVEASGGFTNRGEASSVELKLKNPSASLAFFVHVSLIKGQHGSDVLPVYWSTNYVSLFPGESTEIRGTLDENLLGKEEPHLMISGWNIAPKELLLDGSNREVTPKIDYIDFKAPATIGVGRRFEVSVTVRNAAKDGACLVKGRHHLYIDGKPTDFQRTALAPGESKRLMWPYTMIFEPGEHQVTIGEHPAATVIVKP